MSSLASWCDVDDPEGPKCGRRCNNAWLLEKKWLLHQDKSRQARKHDTMLSWNWLDERASRRCAAKPVVLMDRSEEPQHQAYEGSTYNCGPGYMCTP